MLERDLRIIIDELITALKENRVDDAESTFKKLEELIGEEAADNLFAKIEIMLLED